MGAQSQQSKQYDDDEDKNFIEDEKFMPVQNCNFRLIYRCEVDKAGKDRGTYELYSYYPYHNHELSWRGFE